MSEVDNIVSDMMSRLSSTYVNKYEPNTSKSQCRVKDIFSIGRYEIT